ncbi:hypothetical protein Tco_1303888 [Tanacetum coccineum]
MNTILVQTMVFHTGGLSARNSTSQDTVPPLIVVLSDLTFRFLVLSVSRPTLDTPRAVIYRDRNNQKKMMRESEVHKFSDGTLTRILEKMDHMVKDFMLFKFNRRIEHIIWFEDDKRRSKEFIEVIERRLKSLESFVSGRLRDVDYRLIQKTE